MRAITLHQPWATLVAIGAKKIETRSRRINYRGPLAIHAGRRWSADDWFLTTQGGGSWQTIRDALNAAGYGLYRGAGQLPLGSILCVVNLVDCYRITEENAPPEPERSFGNYAPGRWAWKLEGARPLPDPIPARGYQGFWTPTPELVEMIQAQVFVGR